MAEHHFPSDFVWGAATAAYQIEGAAHQDGRGESIWDRFSHTPGKVHNGDTGDIACDHYNRYLEDVALMGQIGVKAYRFSLAWPRILPQGDGAINSAGLDFYDRLVDALLDAGITPYATLYHWDLPQALQDRQGGWISRDIVEQFAHYADVVSRHLGDRVTHWATFNEPCMLALLGHVLGVHAPGIKDPQIASTVVHHVLLAHGSAVPLLRQNVGADAKVGIVVTLQPVIVAPEIADQAAYIDANRNRVFLDPIFKGDYPQVIFESPEHPEPDIQPGDFDIISRPIDFVGINYYTRAHFGFPDDFVPESSEPDGPEYTEMGWEVYPPGLYQVIKRVHEDYHPDAIYVTENGAAFDDQVAPDGHIHDDRRINYLHRHFASAHQALAEGAALKGYFVWSLLDNFEWSFGYSRRFGLIRVDYPTGTRTLKDSAHFYASVIAANGLPPQA